MLRSREVMEVLRPGEVVEVLVEGIFNHRSSSVQILGNVLDPLVTLYKEKIRLDVVRRGFGCA